MGIKNKPSGRRRKTLELVRGSTSRDPDDGARGVSGLVASLVARSDGTVRVVIDDVRRKSGQSWTGAGLFTSRDYPAASLRTLRIHPSELEEIGLLVITRLVAQEETEKGGE